MGAVQSVTARSQAFSSRWAVQRRSGLPSQVSRWVGAVVLHVPLHKALLGYAIAWRLPLVRHRAPPPLHGHGRSRHCGGGTRSAISYPCLVFLLMHTTLITHASTQRPIIVVRQGLACNPGSCPLKPLNPVQTPTCRAPPPLHHGCGCIRHRRAGSSGEPLQEGQQGGGAQDRLCTGRAVRVHGSSRGGHSAGRCTRRSGAAQGCMGCGLRRK